jgi:RecA-family ATPase
MTPNKEAIRRHLQWVAGGDLDGLHNALIEVNWTLPTANGICGDFVGCKHFGTDEIDKAAEFMAQINTQPGASAYYCPALRKPETTPRDRHAGKKWVAGTLLVGTEFDDEGAAERAEAIMEARGCPPTFKVRTGTRPWIRKHALWRLDAAITDIEIIDRMMKGLARAFGDDADGQVAQAACILRLAGGVAWLPPDPIKKPDRKVELVEYEEVCPIPVSLEALCRAYNIDLGTSAGLAAPLLDVPPPPAARVLPPPAIATTATTARDWRAEFADDVAAETARAPIPQFDDDARLTDEHIRSPLFGWWREDVALRVIRNTRVKGAWRMALTKHVAHLRACGATPEKIYGRAWTEGWTQQGYDWSDTAKWIKAALSEKVEGWAERLGGEGADYEYDGMIVDPQTGEITETAHSGLAEIAQAQAQADVLPVLDPADWQGKDLPPRRWIVGDWIPEGAVTLLSGDGGTGKSLVALQLAVAVAVGRPWLGLNTASGPSLVLACEDQPDELHRRLFDIASAEGVTLGELSALKVVSGAGLDAALYEADEGAARGVWTRRFLQLGDLVRSHCPRVAVLDTAADIYAANENARRQVRQFVAGLSRLAMESRCAVVLLSHPSRAGMANGTAYSGSTAWNGSVRSRLALARPKRSGDDAPEADAGERVLSIEKANYGTTGTALKLRWSSGVFEALDAPGRLDRIARDAQAERAFLDGMAELERQGRGEVGPSVHGANFAPSIIAKLPDCQASKPELTATMERLLTKGALIVEQAGPPSRRKSILKRVEGVR